MQQQQNPSTHQRSTSIRSLLGGSALVVGLLMSVVGLGAGQVGAAGPTQTVDLHNQDASTGTDCPDGPEGAWHFIIAPNNNGYAFQQITLNVGGSSFTFAGGNIIPNSGQSDNVFVKVPSGYTVDDLISSGSSAKISPASPAVKFVLSHVCQADIPTTTTTVEETTTTTVDDTTTTTVDDTTTTTVDDTTTTTVDDTTTTTVDDTTTTTVDDTTTTTNPDDSTTTTVVDETTTTIGDETTTTIVDSGGPTTTAVEVDTTTVKSGGPTTTIVASEGPTTTSASFSLAPTRVGSLPKTGADNAMILVIGGMLTLVGAVILMTGRRPKTI